MKKNACVVGTTVLSSVCCLLVNLPTGVCVSRDNEVIDDSGWHEITDAATSVFESEALVSVEISPEDFRVHVAMRVSNTADCNLSFCVTLKEQIRFIE